MSSKRNLKKKVMRRAAKSAGAAKHQLDQVLLKLDHPAVKRFSEKIKAGEAGDIIITLTQRILEQAQAIRATLDPVIRATFDPVKDQVNETAKYPRRTLIKAGRAASNLAKKISRQKPLVEPVIKRVAKKSRKKSEKELGKRVQKTVAKNKPKSVAKGIRS